MQAKPIIHVENMTHIYPGDVVALKEVSLDIYKGEIVAVLGSNGSGKTTLVKHFNGLLKPSKGEVIIDGLNSKEETIARLSSIVGYVFQNPSHQIFLSTVEDELYYGLKNLKVDPDEATTKVQKAVELFQLQDFLRKNPFDLNSSQRKTIAMASIMAIEPKVIVLDEPTTGQDNLGVERISKLIRMFHKMGHTVVIITHDMNLVGELGCRVIIMKDSEKIADDTVENVFTDKVIMKKANLEPPQITELTEELECFDNEKTFLTVEQAVSEFIEKQVEKTS